MPGPRDVAELQEPLRTAVETLIRDSGGRVYLVSGRRSNAEQISLRKAHCGTSAYDVFDKPSSQCSPPTAKPGTSKHETGQAADLGGDLAYVESRAGELHIKQTVNGERWHFESTSPGIPGLGIAASSIATSASSLGGLGSLSKSVAVLTDGDTWMRFLWIMLGLGLVGGGVLILAGESI